MERSRFDELLDRHSDGIATQAELEELAELLKANPEYRCALVERTRLETSLHDLLGTQAAAERPSVRVAVRRRLRRPASSRSSVVWKALGAIAALVALVALLRPNNRGQIFLGHPTESLNATLIRDGKSQELRGPIFSGDVVVTGEGGFADIDLVDETRVTLSANGRMTMKKSSRERRVQLEGGTVFAAVTKQKPGESIIFATATAEATVVGTALRIADQNGETRLEVTEGLVNLARTSDGKSVDVAAGQVAVAAPGKELVAVAMAAPEKSASAAPALERFGPPLVSVDFENGSSEGWLNPVVPGGPDGSRFAIRSDAKDETRGASIFYSAVKIPVAKLPGGTRENEWIFAYQPDLVLQFSYFIQGPTESLRAQGFNRELDDNFGLTLERPVIGQWTTVQIRIDRFQHNDPKRRAESLKPGTHFRSLHFQTLPRPTTFMIDNVTVAPLLPGADTPQSQNQGGAR